MKKHFFFTWKSGLLLVILFLGCRRQQDLPPGSSVDADCDQRRTGKIIFQNNTRDVVTVYVDNVVMGSVASGRQVTTTSLSEGSHSFRIEKVTSGGTFQIDAGSINVITCELIAYTVEQPA